MWISMFFEAFYDTEKNRSRCHEYLVDDEQVVEEITSDNNRSSNEKYSWTMQKYVDPIIHWKNYL